MDQLKDWLSAALKPCDSYNNTLSQSGQKVLQALHNEWYENYGRYVCTTSETSSAVSSSSAITKDDVCSDISRQVFRNTESIVSTQKNEISNCYEVSRHNLSKHESNVTYFNNIACSKATDSALFSLSSERITDPLISSPNYNRDIEDASCNIELDVSELQKKSIEYLRFCTEPRSQSPDRGLMDFENLANSNKSKKCFQNVSLNTNGDSKTLSKSMTTINMLENYGNVLDINTYESQHKDEIRNVLPEKIDTEYKNNQSVSNLNEDMVAIGDISIEEWDDLDNLMAHDAVIFSDIPELLIGEENMAHETLMPGLHVNAITNHDSHSQIEKSLYSCDNMSGLKQVSNEAIVCDVPEILSSNYMLSEEIYFGENNTTENINNDISVKEVLCSDRNKNNTLPYKLKPGENMCDKFNVQAKRKKKYLKATEPQNVGHMKNLKKIGCLVRDTKTANKKRHQMGCTKQVFNIKKTKSIEESIITKTKEPFMLKKIENTDKILINQQTIKTRTLNKPPTEGFEDKTRTDILNKNKEIINNTKNCDNIDFSQPKPDKRKMIQTLLSFGECKTNSSNTLTSVFGRQVSSANKVIKKQKMFQVPFKNKFNEIKIEPSKIKIENEVSECSNLKINILNSNSIITVEQRIHSGKILEVGLTIVYREGYCQLNKPAERPKQIPCSAEGIMLSITMTDNNSEYYFFNFDKRDWDDMHKPKRVLIAILENPLRKICFKAQEILIYLIKTFGLKNKDVHHRSALLDSMVASWLLDPDNPLYDFNSITAMLGLSKAKSLSRDPYICTCQLLQQLSQVMELLYNKLHMNGLWKLFLDLEMQLIPILATMESRGICVDQKQLEEFGINLEIRLRVLQESAYKAAGKCFQLNSPLQLRQILYEDLKLDKKHNIKIKETNTIGVKSTSEPMLHLLESLHPLPRIILEYRHLQKLKSTYVDAILQHINNGRIFTTWDQISAVTGRIVSSNPNLQAIPKQGILLPTSAGECTNHLMLRSPYQSHPGYALLAADFQHIELRIFAHLAQDSSLLQVFQQPGDIFQTLAQLWLGKTGQTIRTEDREKTKRIVYSLMYGAGPRKLAEFLKINNDEATHIINRFIKQFPTLRSFSNCLVSKCRIKGCLNTVSGRRRLFPNICSPNMDVRAHTERQAINFVIQGSAADVCKAYMLHTQSLLTSHPKVEAHLLLQIHDELVWEVRETHMETFKGMIKNVMQDTNNLCEYIGMFSIPLPVSITTGKNWGEMHS